jgi:hypothetical protein
MLSSPLRILSHRNPCSRSPDGKVQLRTAELPSYSDAGATGMTYDALALISELSEEEVAVLLNSIDCTPLNFPWTSGYGELLKMRLRASPPAIPDERDSPRGRQTPTDHSAGEGPDQAPHRLFCPRRKSTPAMLAVQRVLRARAFARAAFRAALSSAAAFARRVAQARLALSTAAD